MLRPLQILLVLVALLALALPASAGASGRDVIRDCADDGVIDGDYSDEELREAEDDLPSDIDEYTDCREAIRAEMGSGEAGNGRRGTGGAPGTGGGTPGGGNPALQTADGAVAGSPSDLDALGDIAGRSERGEAPSLSVDGRPVVPGETSGGQLLGAIGGRNDVPAPLAAVLAMLALLVLGAAGVLTLRRRRAAVAAGGPGSRLGAHVLPVLRRVSPARLRKR